MNTLHFKLLVALLLLFAFMFGYHAIYWESYNSFLSDSENNVITNGVRLGFGIMSGVTLICSFLITHLLKKQKEQT